MNKNATPENIAAAENVVAEQTQRTVEQIEANQMNRKTAAQSAAELEHAFRNVEKRNNPVLPKTILSGTLIVRSVDGLDGGNDEDRKMVVLASGDGTVMLEVFTNDERFLREGASVTIEVFEPATSLDPAKSGSGPDIPLVNPQFQPFVPPKPASAEAIKKAIEPGKFEKQAGEAVRPVMPAAAQKQIDEMAENIKLRDGDVPVKSDSVPKKAK